MILDQDFQIEGNKVKLYNTIDTSGASELAKETSNMGGVRDRNIRCLGYIPPEMWNYNFWLVTARKAQLAGDMGEYQKHLMKFFELYPQFSVKSDVRQWQGVSF